MITQLHCAELCAYCGHRFGRRARSVIMFEQFLLCEPCWHSSRAHTKLFRGCTEPFHTPKHHGGTALTIGRARDFLTHPTCPTINT
jgi:hypothetical protein